VTSAKTGKKKRAVIKKLGFYFGILLAFVAQWHNKAWNAADLS